jgi:hypothetical protein
LNPCYFVHGDANLAKSNRSILHHIEYHPGLNPTSPTRISDPIQPITETPMTKYQLHTAPFLPTDNVSPLGSSNIFTDIVILDNETQPTQYHPRHIKCVRHPLDDRDGAFLAPNWSRWHLAKLQRILLEVKEYRTAYWERQPSDHRRFGRREVLAREHSIKFVGQAIADQEESNRRKRRVEGPMMCAVMQYDSLLLGYKC